MIGVRLGPWVIEREIGRGGMGAVYLARRDPPQEDAPAQAAVKVLAAELAIEEGFRQRFQREIDILRQLDHPAIVRFYESGERSRRYYYLMEYVPGQSYEARLAELGRIPWREVLVLACQIAPALKHAHDRGVIHRDLKPSNLLLASPAGPATVKLTDFGIASLFASPHLTVTGGVIGTPEYLSPEQAAGKQVTKRSDLYSLGVVLYTLITGRTPFEGEPVDLLHKHRFGQFDRPTAYVPDLHHDFEEIICSLLEKDPAKRPPDAGVLARRLDSLQRKLDRLDAGQVEPRATDEPQRDSGRPPGEGPATMMSRLMRRELERQKYGGPVRRVLEHPVMLVILFALTVGVLVWTFWPASQEGLFRRGAELMASENPDDWDRAWNKYLTPLEEKFPDHPYQEEVARFRRRYQERQAVRRAEIAARRAGPVGEGQWFYLRGLRLREQGNEAAARRVWQALIDAYREVPAEVPWVRLAEKALAKEKGESGERLDAVRAALGHVAELRKLDKGKEADAVLKALKELYSDDPAVLAVLKKQ